MRDKFLGCSFLFVSGEFWDIKPRHLSNTMMLAVQLPAHFIVWLTSPEGSFLNGRSVWANWDVDELKAKKDSIQQSQLFTAGINGWPFAP